MKLGHHVLKHDSTIYIRLDTRLCQACWKCVEACPNGVIGKVELLFHKHSHINHAERCKGCKKCVTSCQQHAIIARNIRNQEN